MHSQSTTPLSFITKWLPQNMAGLTVLDYACGGGRHGKLALDRGAHVTFTDIDLENLSDLAIKENVTLLQADLEDEKQWPLVDRQYDVVIVTNYLYRPRLPDVFAAVKTGGMILYRTFAEGNEVFGKPSNPDYLLKSGELLIQVQGAFSVRHYEQGEVETPNSAIVQRLVAKRD